MARLLILLVLITLTQAPTTKSSYEFLKLVQIWGPSFCEFKPCRRWTTTPMFTLHGLWPDNYTINLYMCIGSSYAVLRDQNEINDRDDFWFDYTLRTRPRAGARFFADQDLWKREWKRHGTCSEGTFSQPQYFQLAERLMALHDIGDILYRYNPPIKFASADRLSVMNAIQTATGFQPEIRCRLDVDYWLLEVVLCFDNGGNNLIDCPGDGFVNCGNSTIYIPQQF